MKKQLAILLYFSSFTSLILCDDTTYTLADFNRHTLADFNTQKIYKSEASNPRESNACNNCKKSITEHPELTAEQKFTFLDFLNKKGNLFHIHRLDLDGAQDDSEVLIQNAKNIYRLWRSN